MVSLTEQSEWVRALRAQDHMAFERLVDEYTPLVAACARRYGLSPQELDDVVNSTFLKAYRGIPTYRGEAALKTWLYRIACHQSVNILRKSKRQHPLESCEKSTPATDDPLQSLQREELSHKLQHALDQLPRHWADVIILRYWNHMSIAQIAEVVQVSNQVARSYLYRARQRLRLTLET